MGRPATRTDQLPVLVEKPGAAALPALVEQAGGTARFAWDEFFSAEIRSTNTRRAYVHAVHSSSRLGRHRWGVPPPLGQPWFFVFRSA